MLEPLADFIRLERTKRNFTQEELADRAGVSRWQLNTFENHRSKPFFEFVVRLMQALELTEIPVTGLRLRAASPDLAALVTARAAVDVAMRVVRQYNAAAGQLGDIAVELEEAAQSVDSALKRSLTPARPPSPELRKAIDRLEATPPEEREKVGRGLRELAEGSEPRTRVAPARAAAKAAARTATRKRAR